MSGATRTVSRYAFGAGVVIWNQGITLEMTWVSILGAAGIALGAAWGWDDGRRDSE